LWPTDHDANDNPVLMMAEHKTWQSQSVKQCPAMIRSVVSYVVTGRKDNALAVVQSAIDNVAGSSSISAAGGLIHATA